MGLMWRSIYISWTNPLPPSLTLTSGTELILIGWKIAPNEEHVQCDHRFASQPLANEPLHAVSLCKTVILYGKR